MSNFSNILQGVFSNENFKNLLPSHSRNVNIMYQTREIINKLSWTSDFLPVINFFPRYYSFFYEKNEFIIKFLFYLNYY